MLTRRRKAALVIAPAVLAALVIAAVVVILVTLHGAILRWTALAGTFTAAALLAALFGLPVALYQLFVVQVDLSRLVPVPEGHVLQLRNLLDGCQMAVGGQRPMNFGDAPDQPPIYRDAFFAHFPDLPAVFTNWDRAAEAAADARQQFAVAIAEIADEEQIGGDTYDRATILEALEGRTPPALHLTLEEWAEDPPVESGAAGQVVVAGRVINVAPIEDEIYGQRPRRESELQELLPPLVRLCRAHGCSRRSS